MTSTLIGLFDTPAEAEQARSKIMASNVPSIDVQVYDKAGFQLTGGNGHFNKGIFRKLFTDLGIRSVKSGYVPRRRSAWRNDCERQDR